MFHLDHEQMLKAIFISAEAKIVLLEADQIQLRKLDRRPFKNASN
jgi:hypothetical protein